MMNIQCGQVVRSKAGRDFGDWFIVMSVFLPYVLLCDGKNRSVEHPKKKKIMHIAKTDTVLDVQDLKTNLKIRKALAPFKDQKIFEEKGGI